MKQKTKEEKEDKIKEKATAKKEYEKMKEEIERQKKILHGIVDQQAAEFNIESYLTAQGYPMINIDDEVIVNKYSLIRDSGNEWDSGAQALITYSKVKNPILCKVTGIKVSKGYAYDRIDDFFYHGPSFKNDQEMINAYTHFAKMNPNPIVDDNCLFVEVLFDTLTVEFQPSWGLNVFSFLPLDSEEGTKTFEVWKAVNENSIKLEKARQQEKELMETSDKLVSDLKKS